MNLSETIAELKFDYVNSNIEKNFTLESIRSTDFVLYAPNKSVSSEDVEKYAQENNLELANLAELLSYAKDGWNNKDWTVALGSSARVDGDRRVPSLDRDDAERSLDLDWYDDNDWPGDCRFLLFRKPLESRNLGPSDLGHLVATKTIKKGEKITEKNSQSIKVCPTCKREL